MYRVRPNNITSEDGFQTHENRVIRAATLFAEGARLLHEETFDLLNLRQAAKLRLICNAVQRLVPALQRLSRATKAKMPPEHSAPQSVSADSAPALFSAAFGGSERQEQTLMALGKPTWFKMDPAAFFSDAAVDAMSTLELGACFRLLGRQWIDGCIPNNLRLLARLCRLDDATMAEVWVTLCVFFPVVEPDKRANRFMWIEREKVIADLERKSDEGRRAANKLWTAKRSANASPNASPNEPPSGSSNGSSMPDPMQEKRRVEQSREENTFPQTAFADDRVFVPEKLPPQTDQLPVEIIQPSQTGYTQSNETPDGLCPNQYATWLLEEINFPIVPDHIRAVAAERRNNGNERQVSAQAKRTGNTQRNIIPAARVSAADTNRSNPTEAQLEQLYKLYPRKREKLDAKKAIRKAVGVVMAGDPDHPAMPLEDALNYIAQRITLYTRCVQGCDPKFIPYPASWFNAGSFWDDERDWSSKQKGKTNGNGAHITGNVLDYHRELLEDGAQ
jgi:uncharacterized protein YdaU (DUF1376 family)